MSYPREKAAVTHWTEDEVSVALGEPGDALADLFNPAGVLVAEGVFGVEAAYLAGLEICADYDVRVACAGARNLQQRLARTGVGLGIPFGDVLVFQSVTRTPRMALLMRLSPHSGCVCGVYFEAMPGLMGRGEIRQGVFG